MSSPHTDDAFAFQFDDAVDAMHHHTQRGSRPSAGLWGDIRSQMHTNTSEPIIAPNARDEWRSSHRTHAQAINPQPRRGPAWPRSTSLAQRRRVTTWITIGLVVGLIVSGLYLNLYLPTENNNQQLAWAPGTVTTNPADEIAIASPFASPSAIEYGPEYACNVEPLTADIVLDMVINPDRELVRRGLTTTDSYLSKPHESVREAGGWNYVFTARDLFGTPQDAELTKIINNAANQFWNCLMTGTSYQVWATMDPSTVQYEILGYFPVFRDEAGLRAYIEKWGPEPYNARGPLAFPDLGNVDPIGASMYADESFGATTVSHVVGSSPDNTMSAIVIMMPHPDSGRSPLNYRELLLSRAPDGTWWVVAINFPDTLRGRG